MIRYICKKVGQRAGMDSLVVTLRARGTLDDKGLLTLLETQDGSLVQELFQCAREMTDSRFGKAVHLRALIEWSNVCRNDCLYCGIRKSNRSVCRYSLTQKEILQCCEKAWNLGLRTFVLQGGENPPAAAALASTVAEIRSSWPEAAITLSLGELPAETYALLRRSGADRYLLRHETASETHYARLHPAGMQLRTRLQCLRTLKELGFQTGTGMMVGSPGQTVQDLLADIRFIESFRPEMIGIGPFVPSRGTPFAQEPAGSPETTLRLYAILRLMHPAALIPSTTALSTLHPDGWTAGLLAGANVLMPSFTPYHYRSGYSLYDGKNAPGREAEENLLLIRKQLSALGYGIAPGRGDYENN